MKILQASEEHIPAIVDLLRLSLGEGSTPKSEGFWRWKHIHNPFGASYVSIAVIDGTIVGVRSFVKWKFKAGESELSAVRAVDTAVHPSYQRRGIFSAMNQFLLERCLAEGVNFVFNTPNKKSLAGNLKMGWEQIGRLPVTLSFPGILNSIRPRREDDLEIIEAAKFDWSKASVKGLLIEHLSNAGEHCTTAVDAHFLQWRYSDVPIHKYYVASTESRGLTSLLVYRIRTVRRKLRELRIVFFASQEGANLGPMKLLLDRVILREKVFLVSMAEPNRRSLQCMPKPRFSRLQIGPIVVGRGLNSGIDFMDGFRGWAPTIGDLELF